MPAMASELWQRIKAARAHAKLTQQDVAMACGIDRAAVSQWESKDPKKRTRPTWDNLQTLAFISNVPFAWLVDDAADPVPPAGEPFNPLPPEQYVPPKEVIDAKLSRIATRETPEGYVRFPLLEGFAGMGRGDYVGDYPEIVEYVEVTREWAAERLSRVPHQAIRVITGRGQSMKGMYENGDLVFVDSRVKQFVDDAAYVFRFGGRVQIKRLQWIGGKLKILSANPAYEPIEVSPEDLEIGGLALAAWTLKEF